MAKIVMIIKYQSGIISEALTFTVMGKTETGKIHVEFINVKALKEIVLGNYFWRMINSVKYTDLEKSEEDWVEFGNFDTIHDHAKNSLKTVVDAKAWLK